MLGKHSCSNGNDDVFFTFPSFAKTKLKVVMQRNTSSCDFGEFCTFLCIEQFDKKNSVRQLFLLKCVAWLSFSFFRVNEVMSGPEACSWKHYAALLIHVPLQKLDDVLKELHGSHYIFILLRKENRGKRKCAVVHKAAWSPSGKTCQFDDGFLPFGRFLWIHQ